MSGFALLVGCGLAGFAVAWAASLRFPRWLAPLALLIAGAALWAMSGVLAQHNADPDFWDRMVDTERNLFNAGFFALIAAATASSWMWLKNPFAAFAFSALLGVVAFFLVFAFAASLACGWFGDCL